MITRYFAYFVTNTFKVLHKKGETINVSHIATLYYIKYVCCVGGKSHQGDEDVCQPVDPSKSRFAFLLACCFFFKKKQRYKYASESMLLTEMFIQEICTLLISKQLSFFMQT